MTQKPTSPRKGKRFGRTAKTLVSMTATVALLGGWNWIAHIDAAQANQTPANDVSESAFVQVSMVTPTSRPTPTPWPTLAPLVIPPAPTLPPPPSLAISTDAVAAASFAPAPLLELPAVAPLPIIAPLPAMPSLPPPPRRPLTTAVTARAVEKAKAAVRNEAVRKGNDRFLQRGRSCIEQASTRYLGGMS